jgi:hypothetical protein
LIFVAFGIRSTTVQTFLAQKATDFLSKELETTIKIDKLSILFFHKVALDGVFVLDKEKDTLASINTIFVTLKDFSQSKNRLELEELNIQKGTIKINRAKETGDYNYEFLVDYFDSGPSTKKKKKSIDVTLDNIRLTQVNVQYDDYRKGYSDYGMDYDHLRFNNTYLFAGNFKVQDEEISLFIKHISFHEKGGFKLDRFSGRASVSHEGLKFNNLIVKTPESHILFSRLYLLMDEKDDLETFEDSVDLDIKITKSIVTLHDISYFATALEGMDQKLSLEAEVSQKVKNLQINNLKLSTGKNTVIQGDLQLPDFRDFENSSFTEYLSYARIDISDVEKIKLPVDIKERYINLGSEMRNIGQFEISNLTLQGQYSKFNVQASKIKTPLGNLTIQNPILFKQETNAYSFTQNKDVSKGVQVDSLLLGRLLNEKLLGSVQGNVFLNGDISSKGEINFKHLQGKIDLIGFNNYNYKNIYLEDVSVLNTELIDAKINFNDPNFSGSFDGILDFGKIQKYQFDFEVNHADLAKINFNDEKKSIFRSSLHIDLAGKDINSYSGAMNMRKLHYEENENFFDIPSFNLEIQRSAEKDILNISSSILSLNAQGKVDISTIGNDFNNQFSSILPAFFEFKEYKKSNTHNQFSYNINFININPLLEVFVPQLKIGNGSNIHGRYNGETNDFSMKVDASFVEYESILAKGIVLDQKLQDSVIQAEYKIKRIQMNDTLGVNDLSFSTLGSKNRMYSRTKWNPETDNESYFQWETFIKNLDDIYINLQKSYFSINSHTWDIENESKLHFANDIIDIQNFEMKQNLQLLQVNGKLSKNSSDNLLINIQNFELHDFAELFSLPVELDGKLDGRAKISDLYTNINLLAEAKIDSLHINKNEVGNVTTLARWNNEVNGIDLSGDLHYKRNQTFTYSGKYVVENNLMDFNLNFDHTNIDFVNAFMDPQIVTGIRGLLKGNVKVKGSPENPEIFGYLDLLSGNAKVEMLGVNFGLNGGITIENDHIFIDNMPIYDEDGNTGMVYGSLYHTDFTNWFFDIDLNLNEYLDYSSNRIRANNRFLVLNTQYNEDEVYYGKAFVTGFVNISGNESDLNIDVNLKTQEGSQINFPMYGNSELEDDNFIFFTAKENEVVVHKKKVDFTGLTLNLNFDITPDAMLKVIFDERTKDEITARGTGNMRIILNNIGDLSMDGIFRIRDGVYNFVMSIIRQEFILQEGGTISWSGNPYDADLNIRTIAKVNANIAEIMDIAETQKGQLNQEIFCVISMAGLLSSPIINFDIEAPKASESGKAAISGIKSNKDELNRQFFSLLLQKKFQPLAGSANSGTGAGLDFVSNQLNSILNEVSKDVRIGVKLDNNEMSGGGVYELDLRKGFLNDKLILSGSFGVENSSSNATTTNNLIGDISVEYLLDEDGNFRVNIFNESNETSVIQEKSRGHFTQGAGIQYREEFNSTRDFKLFNRVTDVFRKEKKVKETRKKSEKPVPPPKKPQDALPPDEK